MWRRERPADPVGDRPPSPTFTENGAAVDLYTTVAASTIEPGQLFDRLTLTVTNVAGTGGTEFLSIDGTTVTLSHLNSAIGADHQTSISVLLLGGTASVTITKAAGLTAAELQAIIDGLSYRTRAMIRARRAAWSPSRRCATPARTAASTTTSTTRWTSQSSVTVVPVNDEPT